MKLLTEINENLKNEEIENLLAILKDENQNDNDSQKFEKLITEISKLVSDSQTAMEGRLLLIENQGQT